MPTSQAQTIRTMCPMSCHPTLCGMLVDVEDGRLLRVRGDRDNPDSQGFLCVRGQASHEVIGNSQRLLHPLMRARRTEDAWRQASWDEALAHIAAREQLMQLLSAYDEIEDLVNIGAYAAGANPTQDLAIAMKPLIDELLKQDANEHVTFEDSRSQLMELALGVATKAEELARATKNGAPAAR